MQNSFADLDGLTAATENQDSYPMNDSVDRPQARPFILAHAKTS
jgi:hypothetical protein